MKNRHRVNVLRCRQGAPGLLLTILLLSAISTTWSTLATALSVTDNFNDGNANGWTVVDDSQEGPSNWLVKSGMYRELGDVGFFRTALQNGYDVGTMSYLNRSLTLQDYQFSVLARPFSNDGDDIGVMFRYQDANNYYRLSFSAAAGFTRLEKKVNGTFTTLAKNARGFVPKAPLNIIISARQNLFHVSVNGEKLFSFADGSLSSGGVGLYCRFNCGFDNVKLTDVPTAPQVIIAKPEAYSVVNSNKVDVAAVVLNNPAGGTVDFTLGGQTCSPASQSPSGVFHATCSAAGYQNELVATLLKSGFPLDSDTNASINLRGKNYVALGDSITWGLADFFRKDDSVPSGLIISSMGYSAPLTNLLNTTYPYSSMVFNNGFPGDRSATIISGRIDSVLERHADADVVLLGIGTNDAVVNVASGSGCSGAACNNTFKGSVQKTINKITAAGKTAVVAQIPPRFDDKTGTGLDPNPASSFRNTIVRNYNQVIKNELTNYKLGPDLYSFFLGAGVNRFSLFHDALHPNALGYRVMAQLWYNALTGSSGLPFILNGICVRPSGGACDNPSLYKQNLLEAGDPYYVDDSFTTKNMPNLLAGGVWVMPSNSNKATTALNHLELSFTGTATVFVAYDDGEAGKPNWLNGFTRTGALLRTTNKAAPIMRIYRKNKVSNGITLGGNRAPGAAGTPENYVAIIKKN